jgi:hypothetical protein
MESPPPQKSPLAFNNNETIQQYLDRMMNAFSGNKQPVAEKSAVLYKLPGALNKNIITKTLYQNILDLCHSNYQGWVLTMERVRRDIISNDILINKFGGNELEVLAASKSGASLNIAPSYIQDFVLYNLTREIEKIVAPKKLMYWDDKYFSGFCITKDPSSRMHKYHYGIAFFTTQEEFVKSNPMMPAYIALYNDTEQLELRQEQFVVNYLKESKEILERNKSEVLYYYGKTELHDLIIDIQLYPQNSFHTSDKILKLSISGTNSSPRYIPIRDISMLKVKDGNSYAVIMNDEQTPRVTSKDCSFAGDNLIVNPGVECNLSFPIHIGGFDFLPLTISLIKGLNEIPLKPFTKYDELKEIYSDS